MKHRSKYLPHTGIKQLSKKLAITLRESCEGKTPEERAELEAAFLARISLPSSSSPVIEEQPEGEIA